MQIDIEPIVYQFVGRKQPPENNGNDGDDDDEGDDIDEFNDIDD